MVADKVGEIYFLNLNNLDRLPKDVDAVPGRNQDQEDVDQVAQLLYGHQQTCTALFPSLCNRFLVSVDTLNKVIVNNWPNVFNQQSVNCDQKADLKDVCLF